MGELERWKVEKGSKRQKVQSRPELYKRVDQTGNRARSLVQTKDRNGGMNRG
jgi:hypothetical protein